MAAKKQGASIVFVNSERRVLLYLRDNKPGIPYPACWDLLGGTVEPGESPEQCIRREVREEIEFDLKNPQLFTVRDFADRVEHICSLKKFLQRTSQG